jgi:hypothetical protein
MLWLRRRLGEQAFDQLVETRFGGGIRADDDQANPALLVDDDDLRDAADPARSPGVIVLYGEKA